ncbi:sigma-70 family RNA polymerase sigma factor [Paraburkholderia youngii]|uniref:sigma-70 family RNA polymerase sigma factor n=1 Tax=Paraburkholderia youngii TaxID=2782701 RepID=UPI003D1E3BE2
MSLAEYRALKYDLHGCQLVSYEDFESTEEEPWLDKIFFDHEDPLAVLSDSRLREAVIEAIDSLPEREKVLMSLYYERKMNLKEVGAVLEVTESRACQLHAQAITPMRTR